METQLAPSLPGKITKKPIAKASPKKELFPGLTPEQQEELRSQKNMIRNYGKAICSFAVNTIALPYIENILEQEQITEISLTDFFDFVRWRRSKIETINTFKESVYPAENDGDKHRNFKKLLFSLAEVFMKHYCVNWIYSSKLGNKMEHLKYRFRFLRMLKSPVFFANVKSVIKKEI